MPKGFEDLDVYRLSEEMADQIWGLVIQWDAFAKNTVGGQLVRAADSVGANIAEGSGRGTYKDNCHFTKIGRGSFYEVRHHLRRAFRRNLLNAEQVEQLQPVIKELSPRLNAYIRTLSSRAKQSSSKKLSK